MLQRRRLRVLVVDDDPQFRDVLAQVLSAFYSLHQAADGLEALTRLVAGETFDVVVSDVMMPGMTGPELATALSDARDAHANRLVLMTAGATSEEAARFLAATHLPVLRKPFRLAELRERIAAVAAATDVHLR